MSEKVTQLRAVVPEPVKDAEAGQASIQLGVSGRPTNGDLNALPDCKDKRGELPAAQRVAVAAVFRLDTLPPGWERMLDRLEVFVDAKGRLPTRDTSDRNEPSRRRGCTTRPRPGCRKIVVAASTRWSARLAAIPVAGWVSCGAEVRRRRRRGCVRLVVRGEPPAVLARRRMRRTRRSTGARLARTHGEIRNLSDGEDLGDVVVGWSWGARHASEPRNGDAVAGLTRPGFLRLLVSPTVVVQVR